jgi:hypothetical protein
MYAIRWIILTPMRHVRGLYLAPFDGDPLVDTLQSFAPRWTPERGKAHTFEDKSRADEVVDLWSTDVRRYLEIVDIDAPEARPTGEPARIVTGAEAMTAYGLTPVRAAILQALPSGHGSPMSIDEVAIALRHRDGLRDRLHDEVREELLSMRDGGLVVGSDEPDVEHRRWCRSLNGSFLRAAFCHAIEARANEREP